MAGATIIRETFSSRDDAEEARQRLEYGGFARNSIDLIRRRDQYELAIHTREANRQRVLDCIDGSRPMFAAPQYAQAWKAMPSAGGSLLLVGAIAGLGAGLYYAFTNRRSLFAQTYPAEDRLAVRKLYEENRRPAKARTVGSSRRDCDLPENSIENLDRKLDHALKETFPTSDPVSVSITK
jgi:hypothetical protein